MNFTFTFAICHFFYFSTSLILGSGEYLKSFSPEQLNALAMLAVRSYGLGSGFFMVFYGVASLSSFLMPMFLAGLAMTVWLLIKGVDVAKWQDKALASERTP